MVNFNLIVKGFDSKEYALIERIVKVLSIKEDVTVRYTIIDDSKMDSTTCLLLNQDAEGNWLKELEKLHNQRIKIDVVLVVNQSVTEYKCIQRPLTVNKFVKVLDEIVVSHLNYVPDLIIGDKNSRSDSELESLSSTHTHQYRILNRRAMVVDDSESILKAMQAALSLQDFQVDLINIPHLALDHIERHEYHIIFLDIMMPGLNGYDLAKEIRKIDKTVPLVMLTSKNSPLDKVRAKLVGTDHFLTKPVANETLLQVLEKFNLKKISLN